MQAKINSFFKPSSSSIAASVTSDTDDGLAVWEHSRNAIVTTYERRSVIAARSEVLKGCIGKPSKKGASTASKEINKKRNYTQFHLELGQSDFLLRYCSVCGVQYAPGDKLDEKNHQSLHKTYTNGIIFKVKIPVDRMLKRIVSLILVEGLEINSSVCSTTTSRLSGPTNADSSAIFSTPIFFSYSEWFRDFCYPVVLRGFISLALMIFFPSDGAKC